MTLPTRRRVILDAGPAITFCAANKQRILHGVLNDIGDLKAPATVDLEVKNKARPGTRFEAARKNWAGLVDNGHIDLLSDEASDALNAAVIQLDGTPLAERVRITRDLGELMVMAHALVMRDAGIDVVVLIDESRAQEVATRAGLRVLDTPRTLGLAARSGLITDRGAMRKIYAELRRFDDGLVDITQTDLLKSATWARI